jgi:hypothetical protein
MLLRHCRSLTCLVLLCSCSNGADGRFDVNPSFDAGSGGGTGGGGGTDAGKASTGGGSGSGGTSRGGSGGAGGGVGSGGATGAPDGAAGQPDGGSGASGTRALGEACVAGSVADGCRAGLACAAGSCQLGHQRVQGGTCVASGECLPGFICSLGRCAAEGTGAAGASCMADTACKAGLRCGIVGFGAECVPEGTADVGQSCTVSTDCLGGLLCAAAAGKSTCAPIATTGPAAGLPFGLPTAPTLQCEAASTGKVQAYFEVPGAQGSSATADFFRLPFPNDARIKSGKIDLSGFPTPGSSLLGYDPVKVYLDAITASERGWGTSPTVLFRFSGGVDFSTMVPVVGLPSPVQFLDVTDPQNPGNGGAGWTFSGQGGKYICHDWFAVRRPEGAPLEPGHTYAVYLTTVARDTNGLPIDRSPELVALLAGTAPTDTGLANAYSAFAPLRAYLAAQTVDPATILNATVITVAPTRGLMTGLASAANAAPLPVASGWVKCGGAAASPCPDASGARACGAADPAYDEYHALVALPIFQKGTAPYTDAGGDIDTGAPVRTESVCASLTVPKGTMPAAGWPVAVFGHGTGGSFRSQIRPEVSGALAKATTPMMALGYDEVQHGPRRGSSTASPNALFFNFKNPAASRGNPLQGAADVISVGRLARTLTVPAGVTGGAAIKSDPTAIVYFGHSQGSMHGSLGLPYTNDYGATVLAGQGASLMHALLSKTSPENVAAAVPLILGLDYGNKGALFGGENHPVLTIVQQWIDPADPINFAAAIARRRNTGIQPKSVLLPYGLGDTYSPPLTMELYAIAAQVAVAAHDPSVATPDAISNLTEQPVPFSGNFAAGGSTVTLALREYANAAGKDGHFVVFDVPSANADAVRFLSMAAAHSVPQVGQ